MTTKTCTKHHHACTSNFEANRKVRILKQLRANPDDIQNEARFIELYGGWQKVGLNARGRRKARTRQERKYLKEAGTQRRFEQGQRQKRAKSKRSLTAIAAMMQLALANPK